MNKRLNSLEKNDKSQSDFTQQSSNDSLLDNSIEQIKKICDSLSKESSKYEAKDTLELLNDYFNNKRFLNRLLYSQISAYIFEFDDNQAGNFEANANKLINFEDKSPYGKQVENAVIKIYDHCSLAKRQREEFALNKYEELEEIQKKIINDQEKLSSDFKVSQEEQKGSLENAKREFDDTIKNTLRDHITIFGVFSAVIITFVGGISYSASVLKSINTSSIYRVIFSICLLGIILFNVIYLLIYVILKISNIEVNKTIKLKFLQVEVPMHQFVNYALLLVMFINCLCYFIHAEKIRNFIDFLPWT